MRQAADHGEYVTPERLDTVIATLRADIYRAMMMQTGRSRGFLGFSSNLTAMAPPAWAEVIGE